jgi:hypothetical protein
MPNVGVGEIEAEDLDCLEEKDLWCTQWNSS